jgi:hypothetical protein
MTATRTTIAGFALLISAASQARAQQGAPRWGGGGTAASSASNQQATHTHVSSRGPFLTVPGAALGSGNNSAGQASGGSWDGRRPDYGGSPQVQRAQQGNDLSSFFGYVPPRGQTAQNVPVQPAVRLIQQSVEQSAVGSAVGSASQSPTQSPTQPPTQSATQWDLQYSMQPVAQSADQPVVRRGGRPLVQAPKTELPVRHPPRITWP